MKDNMDVLIIDHYDSFTYNLADDAALAENDEGQPYLSQKPEIRQYDALNVEEVIGNDYDALILSPGPGNPENKEDIHPTDKILKEVSSDTPTLGVCLGMEAAVTAYGGTISKAPEPIHGKHYEIRHDEKGIFDSLENPTLGGRYHSLIADELPESLEETAYTMQDQEKITMGVRHEEYPIHGVQFHPESILTSSSDLTGTKLLGPQMMSNFFEIASNYNPEIKDNTGEF